MMGYYYGNMMGGAGWGTPIFGSVFFVLTLVLMVLGIVALVKYIAKN
ncbi:MAG: hypothetical protein KBD19_00640 [Candidatus Moranbacteria bacterium]|nr:hypothetical protein [Candidatus Moranbacteria bacterium]